MRNTLRTIRGNDGCSNTDQSPGAVEMTFEEENESLNAPSRQCSNQPKYVEGEGEMSYGGVSDMSEDDGDEDDRNTFGLPVQHIGTQRGVLDVLVDPKSLAHLPFSDSILIDDRGDVDYRPMFSKMLAR